MSVTTFFGISGLIVVIGFLGNYLFKKTGIPDILILLCIGLLIGPAFNLINPSVFLSVSQIFASLALMILLFEGGLNLNLYKVFQESQRASLLAILGILITMGITAGFTVLVWNWTVLHGLLLGAMIGGSSSSIVVPLIRKIKVNEKIVTLLSLESAFTDALTVVIGITLLQLLTTSNGNGVYTLTHGIASAFSIGAVAGLTVGVIWLRFLKSLREQPYGNILTIGIVFLMYSVIESVGGNGAISSLIFGLVLGNGLEISKIFRMRKPVGATRTMKAFHSEISFLIRTFFFVYLGMIVMISNLNLVLMTVGLSVLLLGGRYLAVFLSSIKEKTLREARDVMMVMLPRGLAAAVLSQLPIAYGLTNASMYPDIVFTVIMSTVLMCTIGVFALSKKYKPEPTKT